MTKHVLFLCTGNYYRSRFAEAVFNHLARAQNVNAVAISRGLKINMAGLSGTFSPHAMEAASARGAAFDQRSPIPLTYGDLRNANLIIAVKEAEHRPMIDASFPGWSQRVIFWNVHDVDFSTPDVALGEIEANIRKLLSQIEKI